MPTKLTVPLQQRVEFASKAWLRERDNYLEARLLEAPGAFEHVAYSASYAYTDAPEALRWPDNRAAFHLRINGTAIESGRGDADDVDYKESADYNQAIAVATTVAAGEPDLVERARRELQHRHGTDAFVTKGEPPSAPALVEVMQDVHDHMARRTIANPNLAHRIEHLGLARNRDELDEKGYTILEGAISEEHADQIRTELLKEIDETSGPESHGLNKPGQQGTAGRLIERGRLFEQTAQHPWVVAMAEHMVGRGCLLSTILGLRKAPGDDTHKIHVDYPLIQEPFPTYSLFCTSIWALDGFDEGSGPTLVVPGSYRENRWPASGIDDGNAVPIHMSKGSVAIWRGNTWHSAQVRSNPGFRVTLHQTYGRMYVRSIDGYMDIDPAILDRNAPGFATLCGLDDMFEKSNDAGAHIEGAVYAMQYLDNYRGLMKASRVV